MSAPQGHEPSADPSVNNQGEFHASKPRAEPMTTHGHQPGQLTSEADQAPEFHAKVLPAGSAPPEHTFEPNSTGETPGQALDNPALNAASKAKDVEAGQGSTAASDTLQGATSGDVHTGLGHPGQGQSSKELRDESGVSAGLQGVGAGRAPHASDIESNKKDFSTPVEGATQKSTGGQFTPGKSDMGTTGHEARDDGLISKE